MRIALTHSVGRLNGLDRELERLGFEVHRSPLIGVRPRLGEDVRRAALQLADLPWLLFASRTAVQVWLQLELPLRGSRLGAVGPATASELRRAGGAVEVVGEPATAAGLADRFLRHVETQPRPPSAVGLPRGDLAHPALQQRLEAQGLHVCPLVVYETVQLAWSADADNDMDVIVLSSPSAVRALPETAGRRATLVTLGPSTSDEVRRRNLVPHEVATPTAAAIVEHLLHLRRCR